MGQLAHAAGDCHRGLGDVEPLGEDQELVAPHRATTSPGRTAATMRCPM